MIRHAAPLALALAVLAAGPAVAAKTKKAEPKKPDTITVKQCVVYADRDQAKRADCTARVTELCNNKQQCDVPASLSMIDGRDVDPGFSKEIRITYTCGQEVDAAGPLPIDEKGKLPLACQPS